MASFSLSGKMPCSKDRLTKKVKGVNMRSLTSFMSLLGISSKPQELEGFRLSITRATSNSETCVMKKDCNYEFILIDL